MKESEENSKVENIPEKSTLASRYIPGHHKLNSYNWLSDIPSDGKDYELVEVRFKNTRKAFYRNVNKLRLDIDDEVAVEASPGHDIGRVSIDEIITHMIKGE